MVSCFINTLKWSCDCCEHARVCAREAVVSLNMAILFNAFNMSCSCSQDFITEFLTQMEEE